MRIRTLLLTTAAALAVAAPAASAAKPQTYTGTTDAGDPIELTATRSAVTELLTYTPTSCVPLRGIPSAGTDAFGVMGRFPFGQTVKFQTDEPIESAMHYSPVTKHFHVTVNRTKRGVITGKLHQNFAFETLTYSTFSGHSLLGWICQGDTTFTLRPSR